MLRSVQCTEPVAGSAVTRHGPGDFASCLVDCLEASGVTSVAGVPDSNLADVIGVLETRLLVDWFPREDAAVAFAVGASLAGRSAVVVMKNAGLGTSLDALLSLAAAARIGVTLVIGWAGTGDDQVPHHIVVGERTVALLTASGIGVDIVRRQEPSALDGLVERLCSSRSAGRSHAVLVAP